MITAKIGRRGQFVIPRLIRRHLNLQEGDRLLLIPEGNRVILQAVSQTLLDLRGSVPVSAPQDFDAIRQQVLTQRAETAVQDEP